MTKPRKTAKKRNVKKVAKPTVPLVPAVIPVVDESGKSIGRVLYDAALRAWKFISA